MKKAIFALGIAIAVLAGREIFYQIELKKIPDFPAGEVAFEVRSGESARGIAQNLESAGLVVSARSFEKFVRRENLDRDLEAGHYVLTPAAIPDLARTLARAPAEQIRVTIREGLTLRQTDDFVAEVLGLPHGEFYDAAVFGDFAGADFLPKKGETDGLPRREGYFFPDTYFFNPARVDGKIVAKKMLGNFAKKTADLRDRGDFSEIVILASLVEKEARAGASERRTVAGILANRLRLGMPLGVDATTRAITGKWTEPLTAADLATDSPWNTRRHAGLPPGAIANFSAGALAAAAEPAATDFLYYLHGRDGAIRYARTLAGHEENIRKFLR